MRANVWRNRWEVGLTSQRPQSDHKRISLRLQTSVMTLKSVGRVLAKNERAMLLNSRVNSVLEPGNRGIDVATALDRADSDRSIRQHPFRIECGDV